MSYFACPQCSSEFKDDELMLQEEDMYLLEDESITVFFAICPTCTHQFWVARTLVLAFEVIEEREINE